MTSERPDTTNLAAALEVVAGALLQHSSASRLVIVLAGEERTDVVADIPAAGVAGGLQQGCSSADPASLPRLAARYVRRTGKTLHLAQSELARRVSRAATTPPWSIFAAPLIVRGDARAVLYLEDLDPLKAFGGERTALFQSYVSTAALAVDNACLAASLFEARESIRRKNNALWTTLDNLPTAAWICKPDGTDIVHNKKWLDYAGITPSLRSLEYFKEIFHPDDEPTVSAVWRHCIDTGEAGEIEARMLRYDGIFRHFLIRAEPIRDENNAIVSWYGTNTDVEDLKRTAEDLRTVQQELERARRLAALGELSVSIAHEINQPLMSIVTNAASCLCWLDGETPNIKEARLCADRIKRDGHRAGDVVAGVRAMARKSPPAPTRVDLNSAIREVLALVSGELRTHKIYCSTRLSKDLVPVLGHRIQLQQVVLNLVMNGVEAIAAATPDLRKIEITSRLDRNGRAEVKICDTGPGVPAGERGRIFDALYTTKVEGLGVGLSMCRAIVEAHGGDLTVSPNRPHGSVFRFSVPAAPEVSAAPAN